MIGKQQTCGRVILDIVCMMLLCSQNAFLDLFLIHHGEGQGFAKGYVWVVVDALVVMFWLICLILQLCGVTPSVQLPQQPRGHIIKEFLFAYMSWLVFAPLLVAKVVRLYNTVPVPSEAHWVFTPEMLRIALSLTGILFVLMTHCHDADVDNVKYKLRIRMMGNAVGFSILDASDILSMLHIKGASDDYPLVLRNVILVFGSAWFILPLLPLLALRIMAAENDKEPKGPPTVAQKVINNGKEITKTGKAKETASELKKPRMIKIRPVEPEMSSTMKAARSLDHPLFERKVIQLRNDMFVSDLKKNQDKRCRSYDNLCSDSSPPGKAIAQSKLSQSLNFSYWNYNQNCKVEAPTLDKPHRHKSPETKVKPNNCEQPKGDNSVKSNSDKRKRHVILESLRHSKSILFNVILFRNTALVSVMDIPFLAIRLHLWLVHGVHASVFLTKNLLMILGLLLQFVYEPPAMLQKAEAKGKAVKVGIMTGIGFP